MTKSKQESVRIDSEILDKLRQIKDERGLPLAEQLRRGMWAFVHASEAEEARNEKIRHSANIEP